MKKTIALLLVSVMLLMFAACGEAEKQPGDQTDPVVEAYLDAAQEQIDSGNWEVAEELLEAALEKTDSPVIEAKLDVVRAMLKQQVDNAESTDPTQPTEETEPTSSENATTVQTETPTTESTEPETTVTEPAPTQAEADAKAGAEIIDEYIGWWCNYDEDDIEIEIELSRDGDTVDLYFYGYSTATDVIELELSTTTAMVEKDKVPFRFEDDGFGNSGTLLLYLQDRNISYVVADYVKNNNIGLGTSFPAGTLEYWESQGLEAADYSGSWADSWGQRATMNIEWTGEYYSVVISWASGASEATEWRMTAYDAEGGSIFSKDCTCLNIYYPDVGDPVTEVVYQNGSASLYIENDILYWDDFTENAGENCTFERMG